MAKKQRPSREFARGPVYSRPNRHGRRDFAQGEAGGGAMALDSLAFRAMLREVP